MKVHPMENSPPKKLGSSKIVKLFGIIFNVIGPMGDEFCGGRNFQGRIILEILFMCKTRKLPGVCLVPDQMLKGQFLGGKFEQEFFKKNLQSSSFHGFWKKIKQKCPFS